MILRNLFIIFAVTRNLPTLLAVEIGDKVCMTGYIMDNFCIDRGTLLDNKNAETLKEPEKHSFHCLIDVGICVETGYQVLGDPCDGDGDDMYVPGFRLDDTDAVLAAGRAAGRCTTCTGESDKPKKGYRATVKGVVSEMGDGTVSSTGPPLLSGLEFFDADVACEDPTVPPLCAVGNPSSTASAGERGNCVAWFGSFLLILLQVM